MGKLQKQMKAPQTREQRSQPLPAGDHMAASNRQGDITETYMNYK